MCPCEWAASVEKGACCIYMPGYDVPGYPPQRWPVG